MNNWLRSLEGYFFLKDNPSRDVTLDTHFAYYNFDDIEPGLK